MWIPPCGVILKAIATFEWLSLGMLVCLASACDRPAAPKEPQKQALREERPEPVPSSKQIAERSEQCLQQSGEAFQRGWKDGAEGAAVEQASASFTSHYNARMKSCFYLLTVDSPGVQKKMLFDLSEGELYGEFLGLAEGAPKTCKLIAFYCASGREWDVLIRPYMEN